MVRLYPRSKSGHAGFSLVELMIVVAIIGILAGLAVPKFNLFQAKARQSEARANLSNIYTLQQSYYGSNDVYLAFAGVTRNNCPTQGNSATLGFVPGNCGKLRYTYAATTTGPTFRATADAPYASIYPGCAAAGNDSWVITQNMDLTEGQATNQCGGH